MHIKVKWGLLMQVHQSQMAHCKLQINSTSTIELLIDRTLAKDSYASMTGPLLFLVLSFVVMIDY